MYLLWSFLWFQLFVFSHCVRPIAHWRLFKIRQQASTPGDSAGRATDTRYQRLYSHTSNTCTQQFGMHCSIYGKASTREDKLSSVEEWRKGQQKKKKGLELHQLVIDNNCNHASVRSEKGSSFIIIFVVICDHYYYWMGAPQMTSTMSVTRLWMGKRATTWRSATSPWKTVEYTSATLTWWSSANRTLISSMLSSLVSINVPAIGKYCNGSWWIRYLPRKTMYKFAPVFFLMKASCALVGYDYFGSISHQRIHARC